MPKSPPPPRSAQKRSGLVLGVGVHPAAVGEHDVQADDVVAGEAALAHEAADAAVQRQPRDARMRDHPAGRGEAVHLALAVELRPERARRGDRDPALGVDAHAVHQAQVDQHPALVDRARARDAVPAAAHGDREAVRAREGDRGLDVGDAHAAHDHARPAVVVHPVPGHAHLVVLGVAVHQHGPEDGGAELGVRHSQPPFGLRDRTNGRLIASTRVHLRSRCVRVGRRGAAPGAEAVAEGGLRRAGSPGSSRGSPSSRTSRPSASCAFVPKVATGLAGPRGLATSVARRGDLVPGRHVADGGAGRAPGR